MTVGEALAVSTFMRPSVRNHLEMIRALLTSEKLLGAVYTERLENLSRWNQGTWRFMSFLRCRFHQEVEGLTTVEKELLNIERGRMILAEPNNTPKGLSVQFEEFQALVNAQDSFENGNFVQCYA
jgi:hypothetical protein